MQSTRNWGFTRSFLGPCLAPPQVLSGHQLGGDMGNSAMAVLLREALSRMDEGLPLHPIFLAWNWGIPKSDFKLILKKQFHQLWLCGLH